jgi:hypothetical protein
LAQASVPFTVVSAAETVVMAANPTTRAIATPILLRAFIAIAS